MTSTPSAPPLSAASVNARKVGMGADGRFQALSGWCLLFERHFNVTLH